VTPETIQVFTLVCAAVTAIGVPFGAVLTYLASRRNGKRIEEIRVSINGNFHELMEVSGAERFAAGRAQARADVAQENAAIVTDTAAAAAHVLATAAQAAQDRLPPSTAS
jgi:hypothetical protein